MSQRSKDNFSKVFVMVEKNYTNLSTEFFEGPSTLKPSGEIPQDILLKPQDFMGFSILLASLAGRSSVATDPFGKSRHSNHMYSFQFVHFWGFSPVGTPPPYPNHRTNSEGFGKFPKNPGWTICTTPLLRGFPVAPTGKPLSESMAYPLF